MGKTITGFFPPSSSQKSLTADSDATRWMAIPVGTEPVNASRLICGCRTRASPATWPSPVTMLTIPGGRRLGRSRRSGGRRGGLIGRLDHQGVTRCQGGCRLGRRELDRMVERDDAAHDAERLTEAQVQIVRRRRDGLALEFQYQPSVVVEGLGTAVDLPRHLADGVAGVADLQVEEAVLVLQHALGALAQITGVLCRPQGGPAGEGLGRYRHLHRRLDVLRGARRCAPERLLGRRVDGVPVLPGRAGGPAFPRSASMGRGHMYPM